jgi:hypothetical protein
MNQPKLETTSEMTQKSPHNNHVLSTVLLLKIAISGPQKPQETGQKTEANPTKPKINHRPPQLATKTEDSFYPQRSGPSSAIDFHVPGTAGTFHLSEVPIFLT